MNRYYALYRPPKGREPWLFGFDAAELVDGEAPAERTVPEKRGTFKRISRTISGVTPRVARKTLLDELDAAVKARRLAG